MPRRIGHTPLWSGPFRVWERMFYDPRPDLISSKTRPPEWAMLASDSRWLQAAFCYIGPPSHILWNIKWPLLVVMLVTVGVAVWEHFASAGVVPPMDPEIMLRDLFRLVSFAMSLLLAFRIQRSYERWKEARQSIASVGNNATTMAMQAAMWVKDPQIVEDFRRFCVVYPFSILHILKAEKELAPIAAALLHPQELEVYRGSRKGRQVIITKLRQLHTDAGLTTAQFLAMDTAIQASWKAAGDATRIRFQAMPHGLSLVCTGFIFIWCLALPFGLWSRGPNWSGFVGILLVSTLLLACDELAQQMEQPFQLIPLDDIVNTYERDINRIHHEQLLIREATKESRAALSKLEPADSKLLVAALSLAAVVDPVDHCVVDMEVEIEATA